MTPLLADPRLPHQIVLRFVGGNIGVSCNCLVTHAVTMERTFLEIRSRWDADEALSVYRAHLEET